MRRFISDSEVRLAVGRWEGGWPPEDGPWYVTVYSRDLMHDLVDGWFPSWEAAMERANALADGSNR